MLALVQDFFSHPMVILALLGLVAYLIKWHTQVNTDRGSFKNFMEEVKTEIKEISGKIESIGSKIDRLMGHLHADTIGTNSPRDLNDLGRAVSDEILA